MSDILLEVDDELRSQQIRALWARYGQFLISLAVVAVIGTAAGVFWHGHKNQRLEEQTGRLVSVLDHSGQPDLKAMDKLRKDTLMPLQAVVVLQLAQRQEQANELKNAERTYLKLAHKQSAPPVVREFASLNAARLGLVQGQKGNGLLREVEPLTQKNAPFRGSALELKGLILYQQGKTKQANEIFHALADDADVPNTIRQRAPSFIQDEPANAK